VSVAWTAWDSPPPAGPARRRVAGGGVAQVIRQELPIEAAKRREGARPADIGQTGEEPWHCLADPEGNEFCLLQARLS
jgi:hypothetical protein